MMIRSTHIPMILNRICDDTAIISALLVTSDGELLGASHATAATTTTTTPNRNQLPPPESFGTLVADIAWDYHRLGEEFSTLNDHATTPTESSVPHTAPPPPRRLVSKMECLFLEMEFGIVGISTCNNGATSTNSGDVGCFVIVIATPDAPLGLVKMRLQTVTTHVEESLLSSTTLLNTTSHNTLAVN